MVLKLDPGGPVELVGLTESFAALARMYGVIIEQRRR